MASYDGLQFGMIGEAITSTEDIYVESRAKGFNEGVWDRIRTGNSFLLKKYFQEYKLGGEPSSTTCPLGPRWTCC